MELKKVLPKYAQMGMFGLCAGVFAATVYLITYNLWFPVFNLVNTSDNLSRLIMDLFIAGMHLFVIFALVPMLAGALFIVLFYGRVRLTQLILANTVVTIFMGTLFYLMTTFALSPPSLDYFMSLWANVSVPEVRDAIFAQFVIPMLTQVVEFIVWSSAGAFIAYLMIYQAWINPRKSNLKQTGTFGLALVSVAAVAPPAITYVATVI